MRLNVPNKSNKVTHEGGQAFGHTTPEQQLRRSVMSCFLWESEFYEDGEAIAERIMNAAMLCSPKVVANIAMEARLDGHLRHAPLLLLKALAKTGKGEPHLVADTVVSVIQRADELTELLAVYWQDGRKPIPAQFKKGLARAIRNFDAYKLAKYNRDDAVKLRDILFLTHAKPLTESQAATWKKLADGTLESPDTWEVALSSGADKKETFERLLKEGNLGYLALLRNLRNMAVSGVDPTLVRDAILARKGGADRVLPFRYVAAARAAPQYESFLDTALQAAIREMTPLSGKTVVLVDVSGSMDVALSRKSDMSRMDAAASLASIINGDLRVFSFSDRLVEVPARRGMAGVDAIRNSQGHGGTYLESAINEINTNVGKHDRTIVITDEQSHDGIQATLADKRYLINVASYQNGVGYGNWVHIDGFSESVLKFIHEYESDLRSHLLDHPQDDDKDCKVCTMVSKLE